MQDEVLCTEGLAHRDQTRALAVLVALSAGWPCTQLLVGLLRSCPQPRACEGPSCAPVLPLQPAVSRCVTSSWQSPSEASAASCHQADHCCVGSELGNAARAVQQMHQSFWHLLISSKSSVFQFLPGAALIIPAALEQQPSAVATSRFSA